MTLWTNSDINFIWAIQDCKKKLLDRFRKPNEPDFPDWFDPNIDDD